MGNKEKSSDIIYATHMDFIEFMTKSKFPLSPRVAAHYTKINHVSIYAFLAGKYSPNLQQANALLDFMVTAKKVDKSFSLLVETADLNDVRTRRVVLEIFDRYGINVHRSEFANILESNLTYAEKARAMTIELMTEAMRMARAEKKTLRTLSTKLKLLKKELL